MDAITRRYIDAKKDNKKVSIRTIVHGCEDEYNLDRGQIKTNSIMRRCQRMRIRNPNLPGISCSPLHDVEQTIVEFALQRSLVNRPFNKSELISFANSLIEGSSVQVKLIKWQKKTKTREEV